MGDGRGFLLRFASESRDTDKDRLGGPPSATKIEAGFGREIKRVRSGARRGSRPTSREGSLGRQALSDDRAYCPRGRVRGAHDRTLRRLLDARTPIRSTNRDESQNTRNDTKHFVSVRVISWFVLSVDSKVK